MSHSCQAIVFRCMDFRIKPTKLAGLLAGIGYPEGTYDLVSLAGSAKDFLSPSPEVVGQMLKQIEVAVRLHQISGVALIMHDNCGAYGITDPKTEEETQTRDLAAITRLLAKHFPRLTVEKFILKGTATGDLALRRV